jgi:tetratricopeptide (TPR) repeat protein
MKKWLVIVCWMMGPGRLAVAQSDEASAQYAAGVLAMREHRYAAAVEAFSKAAELRPNQAEILVNWGASLAQLSRQESDGEKRFKHLQLAAEKFSKAAELKPNDKVIQMMWAETLIWIGDLPLEARTRLGCYQGAVERCKRAAEIAPKDWDVYLRWGVVLLAKLPDFAADDKSRWALFRDATAMFEKSAGLTASASDTAVALANWGSALERTAAFTHDKSEKEKLLQAALEKFQKSAAAIPNSANTQALWGTALLHLGKLTLSRTHLRDAVDKFNGSLALKPNDPVMFYQTAVAYTQLDNLVMAMKMLRKCFECDETGLFRQQARTDNDLALLRQERGFEELFTLPAPSKKPVGK